MPSALVDTGVVGATLPPPLATAKVTGTPATGLSLASNTRTAGGIADRGPGGGGLAVPGMLDHPGCLGRGRRGAKRRDQVCRRAVPDRPRGGALGARGGAEHPLRARPAIGVGAGEAGVSEPDPAAAANSTRCPATGRSRESSTRTTRFSGRRPRRSPSGAFPRHDSMRAATPSLGSTRSLPPHADESEPQRSRRKPANELDAFAGRRGRFRAPGDEPQVAR